MRPTRARSYPCQRGDDPWPDLDGPCALVDLLSGAVFERDGAFIAAHGLYVALDPGGAHLLHVDS